MIFFKKKHKKHFKDVYEQIKVTFASPQLSELPGNLFKIRIHTNGRDNQDQYVDYDYDAIDMVYKTNPLNGNVTFAELINNIKGDVDGLNTGFWVRLTLDGSAKYLKMKLKVNDDRIFPSEIEYEEGNSKYECSILGNVGNLFFPTVFFKLNESSSWTGDINDKQITESHFKEEEELMIAFANLNLLYTTGAEINPLPPIV